MLSQFLFQISPLVKEVSEGALSTLLVPYYQGFPDSWTYSDYWLGSVSNLVLHLCLDQSSKAAGMDSTEDLETSHNVFGFLFFEYFFHFFYFFLLWTVSTMHSHTIVCTGATWWLQLPIKICSRLVITR